MQISHFDRLLSVLPRLTPVQLDTLRQQVGKQDELKDFKALIGQRREASPACPHCSGANLWAWGTTASGQNRLRCRSCLKTFTALTGTGFERLRSKPRLIENIACMAQGLSVRQTADRLQVTKRTAYRLRRLFMPLLAKHQPDMLAGVLEADETFFRKSYKGQRGGLPRERYKRGTPAEKRGINNEHVAVLTAMSRGSRECFISILPAVPNAKSVNDALDCHIAPGSVLCTDGSSVYGPVGPLQGVDLYSVPSREHVDGDVHVQNVNALHSRMKAWMRGFRGVSTKHLEQYLASFRFFDRDSSRKAWSGFLLDSIGIPYFNT